VEWLINGQQFDPTKPLISPKKDSGAVWRIRNGGGGWVHPMHLHMEEHRVVARNGRPAPDGRHPDDTGKEDVIALDPSEEVVISRRFRTFTGPYVAHCHNLAHEDHNMMFGWEIIP
jgi:FtsP/CotA-like multicopper oxidase with cupredoxin domain